jgi:hypothetical protein
MRILFALILALFVASCGSLRVNSAKQVHTVTQSKDSTGRKVTTIREKADTLVKVAGSTAKASKPVSNLQDGDSLVLETDGQRVVVTVDDGGNVQAVGTIKPREIPISIDREIKREDETHVQTDTKVHDNQAVIEKKRDTTYTWLAVPIALLLLALLVLRFVLKRLG